MSAITHLFAGIPVSDLDASIDWYTRLFGRPPDSRVGGSIFANQAGAPCAANLVRLTSTA